MHNKASATMRGKIHPLIMYPYYHPKDLSDLKVLYESLELTTKDSTNYNRAITVMNRQTYYRNEKDPLFMDFLKNTIMKYSEVVHTWSVDTCQMWLTGFGKAFDDSDSKTDVYWLIPGDFNYNSNQEILSKLKQLPQEVKDDNCDLCLGEITVASNSSKQLIDTYGTYGLLYNWFPDQAQKLRKITDKPRSEFFAIGHNYLKFVLERRWFAYEQTIVILLRGLETRKIEKIKLGKISDEDQNLNSLSNAMQQIERTERVLKLYWRDQHEEKDRTWPDEFRKLDAQSEHVRNSAMIILEQILR